MPEWRNIGWMYEHPDFTIEATEQGITISRPPMATHGGPYSVTIPTASVPALLDALSAQDIVHVQMRGQTRDEQPRTARGAFRGSHPPIGHLSGKPVAKGTCEACGALIVAYGWQRRPLEQGDTDPRPPIMFTDWQHEIPTDPAHLATPAPDTVLLEPIMRTTMEE